MTATPTMEAPVLLTVKETARLLKVHRNTLARWRELRKGPAFIESGGQYRYDREAVLIYLAAHTVDTAQAVA